MHDHKKLPSRNVNSQLQYLFATNSVKTLNKVEQFVKKVLEIRESLYLCIL